jgi:hypothetical protein
MRNSFVKRPGRESIVDPPHDGRHDGGQTTESEVEMDNLLTIDEIKTRYTPEWVLIGEPETDEFQRVLGGKVLFHSPDREDVYRKAVELQPGHFAFRYLGEFPENMAFIL